MWQARSFLFSPPHGRGQRGGHLMFRKCRRGRVGETRWQEGRSMQADVEMEVEEVEQLMTAGGGAAG